MMVVRAFANRIFIKRGARASTNYPFLHSSDAIPLKLSCKSKLYRHLSTDEQEGRANAFSRKGLIP